MENSCTKSEAGEKRSHVLVPVEEMNRLIEFVEDARRRVPDNALTWGEWESWARENAAFEEFMERYYTPETKRGWGVQEDDE